MEVLLVEPGKEARIAEIGNDLKSLQAAVGGYIEATYPFDDPVALVCNDEGKIMQMPLNRALRDDAGKSTTPLPEPSLSAGWRGQLLLAAERASGQVHGEIPLA